MGRRSSWCWCRPPAGFTPNPGAPGLAKLIPYNEEHRAAVEKIRQHLWEHYQDLKAYRERPDEAQTPVLVAGFDALVEQRTGYPSIDGVLKEMRDHKADLLRVLERPEVPLHNNGMESDIREFGKRRKISGGTRAAAGYRRAGIAEKRLPA